MQDFRKLDVWRKAHAFVLLVYQHTEHLPSHERFGIVSQIRRASVSVASNIVEGTRRRSSAEFARFLNTSEASGAEVEYLLLLSKDLGYLTTEDWVAMTEAIEEIGRMLHGLRTKVESTRLQTQNS